MILGCIMTSTYTQYVDIMIYIRQAKLAPSARVALLRKGVLIECVVY